jgi:cyclopropane fatty-acyl-phospholipid synthase-like methyltransferase
MYPAHLLRIAPENADAAGYVSTIPEEGWSQLELLLRLGCKPHHRVLEIGCGALVAGFPIMQYLDSGNYTGVDPNGWLAEASQRLPEVAAVVAAKRPRFVVTENFRSGVTEQFDFIVSHSVLSHASNDQLTDFLEAAAEQLTLRGVLAASIRLAEGNRYGSSGSAKHGADFQEWQYPGVSWFRRADVIERARRAGLAAREDPELTKIILEGNPRAVHDWIQATRAH